MAFGRSVKTTQHHGVTGGQFHVLHLEALSGR